MHILHRLLQVHKSVQHGLRDACLTFLLATSASCSARMRSVSWRASSTFSRRSTSLQDGTREQVHQGFSTHSSEQLTNSKGTSGT